MQRFIETASIDTRLLKEVEISPKLQEKINAIRARGGEAVKLVERVLGEGRKVWEVPISKYDEENANGRIYSRELWENVINNQRHVWEGAPMLANHPEGDSDGSPEKICGIWLEARIGNDGYVYGQFVPSGRLGEDLEKHLGNGLRAGTSSSGFGEMMQNSKMVDPKSYMIERLSDWVLTPSQGTYFTYEAATQETKNASDSRLGESANKPESVVRESTKMSLSKLEEKKFRRDMQSFLESADRLDNPQEKLREFEEILTYLDEGAAPDLRESVVAKIESQRKLIETRLSDAARVQTELGVAGTDQLKERLAILATEAEVLQEDSRDWERIATLLQEKLDKALSELNERPTTAYVTHLRGKIKKLYAEKKDLGTAASSTAAAIREASLKKDKLIEAIDAEIGEHKAALTEALAQNKLFEGKVARLQARAKQAEAKLDALQAEFNEYKAKAEAKPKMEPSFREKAAGYLNFQETERVESYWADLVGRHGPSIKPFERHIRGQKTYLEAMNAYMKILPTIDESVDVDAARLPESVSMSLKERGQILERVGVKLAPTADLTDRMPQGWV